MRRRDRLIRLASPARLPPRTVRLRLTLLYGGLFLLSGVALLTITNVLVRQSTDGFVFNAPDGRGLSVVGSPPDDADGEADVERHVRGERSGSSDLDAERLAERTDQLEEQAQQDQQSVLDEMLVQSGIALGLMAAVSIGLGWIVAGRVLRPLRTITSTARRISATNLHERLALDGPDDELKELGDTLDELLGRLDDAFQSQRQFVANASHELRSPLARQRTLLQVAVADPDATVESLREAHTRVLASGAEQERLVNALLALTRGQSGLDRRELFDLATLADAVVCSRQQEAARCGVALQSSLAPTPVDGDPLLVERLIANLVDNALHHNVTGGRAVVETRTEAGRAVLAVANTGELVPESAVDKLFEPFARLADRTGHGDGIGLGLSIVRAIAEAHEAALLVRPHPEGGLHVEVGFPATRMYQDDKSERTTSKEPSSKRDAGIIESRHQPITDKGG